MVRNFAHTVRKVVAIAAMAAIVTTGLPSLAAGQVVIKRGGEVVDVEMARLATRLGSQGHAIAAKTLRELGEYRSKLAALQDAAPANRDRVARLSLVLDILGARTEAERHALVRRLPVTVVRSAPADGRDGVIKDFIARGKVRVRVFVPADRLAPADADGDDRIAGPAAHDECYGGEPPCATEEEMDDLWITIADGEADAEAQQGEYDSEYADYSDFCNSNPSQCELPGAQDRIASGPAVCVDASCWGEAGNAAANLAVYVGANLGAKDAATTAAASGLRMTATAAVGWKLTILGSAFIAGYSIGTFISCKVANARVPTQTVGLEPYEPAALLMRP